MNKPFQFDIAMLLALTTLVAVAVWAIGSEPTMMTVLALLMLLVSLSFIGFLTTSSNSSARAFWVTFCLAGLAPAILVLILIPVVRWEHGGRFPKPHQLDQYRTGLLCLWAYLPISAALALAANRFLYRSRERHG